MNINKTYSSPNFDNKTIPVEFIVIHYTACNLESTLKIFSDAERKVSSHLVISETGEIYETVNCLENEVFRAWHAGQSKLKDASHAWENFNDFSIGIELVNLNGNIYEFKDAQYKSLFNVISNLKKKHKSLSGPERIIGHEQIAGFRGKVDPGWKFDWEKLYNTCYSDMPHPKREPNLKPELMEATVKLLNHIPENSEASNQFWSVLSTTMEAAAKLSNQG